MCKFRPLSISNLIFNSPAPQPPSPAEKWKGLYDATKEKHDCIQYSHFYNAIVGTEDCLYVNVHVPEVIGDKTWKSYTLNFFDRWWFILYCSQPPCQIKSLKTVIVLIHPGGNFWGSGSRHVFGNPDFIVSHDVIVVTFNYRLHALGL